ncbi:MAG: phenylacetic acid degradation protein [Armatimonadetes bacterium]|nr:phenylacetic acid degradation protein [Armatimonadota bacterium]
MGPARRLSALEQDVWAVFRQATKHDPHVYVGDVHASDPEMALLLAKEQYARRDPCVNLWVVRYSQIFATDYGDADMFRPATDRSFRFGGSHRDQQRVYREAGRRRDDEE